MTNPEAVKMHRDIDCIHNALTNPRDPSPRIQVSLRRPVNQDAWLLVITRAVFDRDAQEWKQEYVKDLVWEPYQGFDVLDVSNVTFPGNVDLDLPNRQSARYNVHVPNVG